MFRLVVAMLVLSSASGRAEQIRVTSPTSGPLILSAHGLTTPGGTDALNQFVMAVGGSPDLRSAYRPTKDLTALEVLDSRGHPVGKRNFQGPDVGTFATVRGPCVSEHPASGQQVTRCFNFDLKHVWKSVSGPVSLVNRAGTTAYVAAAPSRQDALHIGRVDLTTGVRSTWTVSTRSVGEEPGTGATHADLLRAFPYARFKAAVVSELPGQRVLVCLRFELPHWGCRWSVHDARTGRLRTRLNPGNDAVTDLQASPTGRYLYTFGTTVRVWDARTGRRVMTLHDPAWAAALGVGGFGPREVLFTADGRRMVVIVAQEGESSGSPRPHRAFVYAVPGGHRITSFGMGKH